MKEYEKNFIWNKFINQLKEEYFNITNQNITEMLVDSGGEDNEENNAEVMPNYNSYYNETFFDDNDMILDD